MTSLTWNIAPLPLLPLRLAANAACSNKKKVQLRPHPHACALAADKLRRHALPQWRRVAGRHVGSEEESQNVVPRSALGNRSDTGGEEEEEEEEVLSVDEEDEAEGGNEEEDLESAGTSMQLDDPEELEFESEESAERRRAQDFDDAIIWEEWMTWNGDSVHPGGKPDKLASDLPPLGELGPSSAAAEEEAADALEGFVKPPRAEAFGGDTLLLRPQQLLGTQSEWDLRAGAEKKQRQERARAAWLQDKLDTVGRFPSVGADWRNDVRIRDTGNPTFPRYREWTIREIWDMIVLDGVAADPRDLAVHRIHDPGERVDSVAEGYQSTLEIPEWLEQQGRLIKDEDADREEEALLAAEFSDFDDFAGGSGDTSGEPDDGFAGQF